MVAGEEDVSTSPVHKAIILRGPPGVGKSAIRNVLRAHLGKSARYINLDAYWGKDEWRYSQPDFRYADLQLAKEPVLVVELAWGEPDGLTFPGATRGANEWMSILQKAKREIFPFFLTAEWNDILKRLTDRHGHEANHNILAELGRASFYEHKHYLFSYPEIPGITERTIDTTGKTAESVAEVIRKVAGV
jgi:broad-specificity NMP kinase